MISQYLTNRRQLPQYLIYKKENVPLQYPYSEQSRFITAYTLIDLKNKQEVGYMYTQTKYGYENDEIYPELRKCNSLYIDMLQINENYKRQGHGSRFINLARMESKKQNCNGRVHLIAISSINPSSPSHIFYRKNGFTTVYSEFNNLIDEFAKIKNRNGLFLESKLMYLPIGDKPPIPKRTLVKNFILNLIKKIRS